MRVGPLVVSYLTNTPNLTLNAPIRSARFRSARRRYVLKRVYDRQARRWLTQAEMLGDEHLSNLRNRERYAYWDNTPERILASVQEMTAVVTRPRLTSRQIAWQAQWPIRRSHLRVRPAIRLTISQMLGCGSRASHRRDCADVLSRRSCVAGVRADGADGRMNRMIDCIAGYHLNPWTCGIAKFNQILARHLELPVVGILDLPAASHRRPLLSLKLSEFAPEHVHLLDEWARDRAAATTSCFSTPWTAPTSSSG